MGLYLAKQQVEGLGGTIELQSSEEGSEFTVILPRERIQR